MQVLNSTTIDHESSSDSVLKIKLISYDRLDTLKAREIGYTLDQLIFETYNHDWSCHHSHDCCGCWAQFVIKIQHIRKGVKAVTIRHSKNV